MDLDQVERVLILLREQNYIQEIVIRAGDRGIRARAAPAAVQTPSPIAESAPGSTPQPRYIVAGQVGFVQTDETAAGPGMQVEAESVVATIVSLGIASPVAAGEKGVISHVLVSWGEAVEYGQPLFELEAAGEDMITSGEPS